MLKKDNLNQMTGEKLFQRVFDAAAVGIIVLDENRMISHVNQYFVDLLGYAKKEIEGQMSYDSCVHPADLVNMLQYHNAPGAPSNVAQHHYEVRLVDCQKKVRETIVTVVQIEETKQSIVSFLERTERTEKKNDLLLIQRELESKNIALREVLSRQATQKADADSALHRLLEQLCLPILQRAESDVLDAKAQSYFSLLREAIRGVTDNLAVKERSLFSTLTPRESEICYWIKQGLSGRAVAEKVAISFHTLETHRKNIRKKLELTNSAVNLRTYLNS